MSELVKNFFWERTHAVGELLLAPGNRIFYVYLLSALAIACVVYIRTAKTGSSSGLRPLGAFLFPRAIYSHASTKIDLIFLVVNRLFFPIFVGTFVVTAVQLAPFVTAALQVTIGVKGLGWEPGVFGIGVAAILLLLVFDAMIFASHWLQHRIPLLWQFHKVHHSAEVLSPITVYRMHPVDYILSGLMVGVGTAPAYGLLRFCLTDGATEHVELVYAAGLGLFYLCGYNLRHSHIWVNYPQWLSRILISPAQHQVHHSVENRHWDKNMGFIFAFWDQLADTLYVPTSHESFALGLTKDEHREFSSVTRLYLLPFRKASHLLRNQPRTKAAVLVGGALLVATLVNAGIGQAFATRLDSDLPPTVQLEELTWVEVRSAIAAGVKTVIVPSGGVEQSGPHLVLGKHNFVVRNTAERIALAHGKALVAPVIAYVPEGSIEPPSGHMQFAGTLSIPEHVFAQLLEYTARSLKQHGFKVIAFIGDSGGNQSAQAEVAAKLSAEWRDDNVAVLHLGDYYHANGQTDALIADGESELSIGSHAGIRDSAELMVAFPQGIRTEKIAKAGGEYKEATGVIGDPTRASVERGEMMLQLKIDAALRQLYRELKTIGFEH